MRNIYMLLRDAQVKATIIRCVLLPLVQAELVLRRRGTCMYAVASVPMALPRPATASHYFCKDFEWEDLRDEVLKEQQRQQPQQTLTVSSGPAEGPSTIEAWKRFHSLHEKQPFFKERRYLVKEFPELLDSDRELNILEVGCGTGSSVLPVLRANTKATIYACDCSESALKKALGLAKNLTPEHEICRLVPFVCDISIHSLPEWLCCTSCFELKASLSSKVHGEAESSMMNATTCRKSFAEDMHAAMKDDIEVSRSLLDVPDLKFRKPFCCAGGLDIVMLIFTLSSIPPQRMQHVIQECYRVLAPGGLLLFRDYGLYDMTMRRFSHSQRIGDQLYQRGDGTLSYYFTPEILRGLVTKVGFLEEEISFCCVEVKNHKRQLPMKRVWIHAKFLKPKMV